MRATMLNASEKAETARKHQLRKRQRRTRQLRKRQRRTRQLRKRQRRTRSKLRTSSAAHRQQLEPGCA
jgi:hypothetical protein